MIEPRLDQGVELGLVEQDARGDQVAVLAECCGMAHQVDEIAPRGRLAAREVGLQHAEGCGLIEHAAPGRGVELRTPPAPARAGWSSTGTAADSDG